MKSAKYVLLSLHPVVITRRHHAVSIWLVPHMPVRAFPPLVHSSPESDRVLCVDGVDKPWTNRGKYVF